MIPSLHSNISHEEFLAHSIGLLYEFPRFLRQRLHRIQLAFGIIKKFASGNHPVVKLIELRTRQCAHECLDASAVVSPGKGFQGAYQLFQRWLEVYRFEMVLVHHDALNHCTEFFLLVIVSIEIFLV